MSCVFVPSTLSVSCGECLQGHYLTDSALKSQAAEHDPQERVGIDHASTNVQMTSIVVPKVAYIAQVSQRATRNTVCATHCLPHISPASSS